jgi:hypothetical protein
MNTRKSILFFIILLSANTSTGCSPLASMTYDLCPSLTCTTNNGIRVVYSLTGIGIIDTAYITSNDSIIIGLKSGCGINSIKMFRDGNIIYSSGPGQSYTSLHSIPIAPRPGYYLINVITGNSGYQEVGFTLMEDRVGLAKQLKEDNELILFTTPNKCIIIGKDEKIKKLIVYNLTGSEMKKFEVNDFQYEILLNNYTPGIYFILVATINDKVVVKKIIIL